MLTKLLTKWLFCNKKGLAIIDYPLDFYMVPKPGFEPGQAYAH